MSASLRLGEPASESALETQSIGLVPDILLGIGVEVPGITLRVHIFQWQRR